MIKLGNETIRKIGAEVSDERGEIKNILEEPISHVAIITSKKGTIRANHYHPQQTQYVYLISGRYESHSKDLTRQDSETEKKTVEEGSLVTTPPMVAHAMKFLEDSVLLNLTPGTRKPQAYDEHTKKYKLI